MSTSPERPEAEQPSLGDAPSLSPLDPSDDPYLGWTKGKPRWNCRLHLWHRWRTHHIGDGGQFQECLDCGKYRDVPQPGSAL